MDARIHPNPERKSAPGSAGLLAAAAREVLQAGLAGFRLLALRLRDDERAAAQVFCFSAKWEISLSDDKSISYCSARAVISDW